MLNDLPDKKELEILQNREYFVIKNQVTKKLQLLLYQLEESMPVPENLLAHFPEGTLFSGKVSRGENHLGFPYLVLDYPRFFRKNDILAIRTMIWMGNYVSSSLHLHGTESRSRKNGIMKIAAESEDNGYFICKNDPWDYRINPDTCVKFKSANAVEIGNLLSENPFFRISKILNFENIKNLEYFYQNCFSFYLRLIGSSDDNK